MMLGFSVCARGRPGLHNFTTITSPHGDASCRCGSTLRPTPARFNHTAMAKPVHKTAHPFNKARLKALLNRHFFYAPAFEIYKGPSHPFSHYRHQISVPIDPSGGGFFVGTKPTWEVLHPRRQFPPRSIIRLD